jgi:hypothetical protein
MTRVPQIVQKSRCQKADMKQVWYWVLTVLDWPVNLTVIRLFLLGVCVCVNWYTFLHVRKETAMTMLTVLGTVVQNSVTLAFKVPEFVYPWPWPRPPQSSGVQWTSFISRHYELLNVTWYITCNATKWGIFFIFFSQNKCRDKILIMFFIAAIVHVFPNFLWMISCYFTHIMCATEKVYFLSFHIYCT